MFQVTLSFLLSKTLFMGHSPLYASAESRTNTIIDVLASSAKATNTPNGKRRKTNMSMKKSFCKPVNHPVTQKDLFEVAYPEGYRRRLDPTDDGGNMLDDDSDVTTCDGMEGSPDEDHDSKKKKTHPYYCICKKCGIEVDSDSNTRYTNGVSHAANCYGRSRLIEVGTYLVFLLCNLLFLSKCCVSLVCINSRLCEK